MWAGRKRTRDLDRASFIQRTLTLPGAWPRSLAIGMLSLGLAPPGMVAVSVMTAGDAWADCSQLGEIVTCTGTDLDGYQELGATEDRFVTVQPGGIVENGGSNPAAINLSVTGTNNIDVVIEGADGLDPPAIVNGPAGANPVGARHGLQLITGGGDVYVDMDPGTMVTGGGTGGDGFRIRTRGTGTIDMDLYGSVTSNATNDNNGEAIDAQTEVGGDGDVTINLRGGTYTSARSDVIVGGSVGGGMVDITVAKDVMVTGGIGTTGLGDDGILVTNAGIANVTVHGTVSGVGGSAVSVMNDAGLDGVEVNVVNSGNSLIGAESGIEIGTENSVETATITNFGLIEGNGVANAVIWASTNDGLTIDNNPVGDAGGLIQATGAATDALIVHTTGTGSTTINNDATMIGVLLLAANTDNVVNNTSYTTWTFTGVSDHGAGTVNNTGRYNLLDILPATASMSTFTNVDTFNNGSSVEFGAEGFINQVDGTTNDVGRIEGVSGGPVAFHGAPGFSFFEQDVDLGDDVQSEADKMEIDGNVTGSTGIMASDLNNTPGGYNPVGITVVQVEDGTTGPGDFYLDGGPIKKGLWTYDLFLNEDNENAPVGDGSSKNCDDSHDCWVIASYAGSGWDLPQTISIAQGMWNATAESWIDRGSDLRTLYGSTGGGGADVYYQPTTEYGKSGVWARAIGQLARRDVSYETEMFDEIVVVDADYQEHLWAVQGGIDHAFEGNHGTTVIGLLGGFANNEVDFVDAGDTASIKAPHVGAYLNWLSDAAYVDVLVKADFLDVAYDIAGEEVGTKGYNIGGRVEAGYRHSQGHAFIEPVASVAYVHTVLDPMTVDGTEVTFNNGQSLRGKVGGRVGASMSNGEAVFDPYVHAYLGNEFMGKNSVFLDSGPGLELTDDVSGIYGEVGGGFNLTHADRTGALYSQGNFIFADGYQAGNLKAGARVNW